MTAWSNLAKDDTFAGMTLQQFTQMVDAVDSHQTGMNNLRAQYTGAAKQRDDLHVTLNETTLAVVDAVKADLAKHGPDSPLYKTMGYVPKSERSSGLTRKTTVTVNSGSTVGTATATANPTTAVPTAATPAAA
ncbi:MAG TPA: hypothetical protein VFC17_05465 [Candidatus Limnocylindrales bacterium]|nr:hypothetical protein [Candidatus Limnocylindrales bacterium]